MSVGNSSNPAKDESMIRSARSATNTQSNSQSHTHNHNTQTTTTENDGLVKLSKVHPQAAAGLKSACAADPAFAEALNSDDDYKDVILHALDKNPQLFSSQESIKSVLQDFKANYADYSKYNAEMDKLGKEDMAKAMTLHAQAMTGKFGLKAGVESATTLAMEYGLNMCGPLGGWIKLAGALNIIKPKDIAEVVTGKVSNIFTANGAQQVDDANTANTQNLAMQQQANSGR